MYKFANKVSEVQKITNFYYKANSENGINIVYRKGDICVNKLITDEDTKEIYVNGNELWILVEKNDGSSKRAVKQVVNEDPFMPSVLMDGSFYVENFWQAVIASFSARISSENVDGKDCYKIYFSDDWQIFVNKEDYIKIKEINGSTSKELIEYSINTVTDEDVQKTNLDGYELQEVN